jgi:hypothetical protein
MVLKKRRRVIIGSAKLTVLGWHVCHAHDYSSSTFFDNQPHRTVHRAPQKAFISDANRSHLRTLRPRLFDKQAAYLRVAEGDKPVPRSAPDLYSNSRLSRRLGVLRGPPVETTQVVRRQAGQSDSRGIDVKAARLSRLRSQRCGRLFKPELGLEP